VSSGEPAHVAKYAFQLAQAFNNFYHQYPIIHEENREKKVFLLWMTDFFRGQLERTAGILGFRSPSTCRGRPLTIPTLSGQPGSQDGKARSDGSGPSP